MGVQNLLNIIVIGAAVGWNDIATMQNDVDAYVDQSKVALTGTSSEKLEKTLQNGFLFSILV
jgi:hypothetical protein